MKGCGDKAWRRVQTIQQAGVLRVMEYARNYSGVQDPSRDMAVIKSAAVLGYKAAGEKHRLSASRVQYIVKRYSEMAEEILKGAPVSEPKLGGPATRAWTLAETMRRCGQGGDGCRSDCPYWALHCADGDCVGTLMTDASRELGRLRSALDGICVQLDGGRAIVDWSDARLEPHGMPEVKVPGSARRYVAVKYRD